MLRVTRLTDYGIVLLISVVRHPDREVHTARDLSDETGLPPPTVNKVLKNLTRCGILVSQRGTKGGYQLARKPEQITVADVITALDGPIALTTCSVTGDDACEIEAGCPTRAPWNLINQAVRTALESVTLRDMSTPLFNLARAQSGRRSPLHILEAS